MRRCDFADSLVSRVMVHLFNRLTRLLARVQRSKATITETDAVEDLVPSQDRQRHSQSPNASPTKTREDASAPNSLGIIGLDGGARGKDTKASASRLAKPVDPLVREARQLNEDVDAWIDSLQLATLEHERVQVGNRAYAHTMKVSLETPAVGQRLTGRSCCCGMCSSTRGKTNGSSVPPSKSSGIVLTRPPCSACPSSKSALLCPREVLTGLA